MPKFISLNVPAASSTFAYGLNNAGQIVGGYTIGNGGFTNGNGTQGFLYSGGLFTAISAPSTQDNFIDNTVGHFTVATGINDAGVIAGYAGAPSKGFVDNGGNFTAVNRDGAVR